MEEANDVHANEIIEWYAINPAETKETTCRHHGNQGEDVYHKVDERHARLVVRVVEQDRPWLVVEVPRSVPMCQHQDDRNISHHPFIELHDAT